MRPAPVSLLILALLFGGCVGSGPGAGPTTPPVETEATVDATTGGIEGLVTDDELAPIGSAEVALVGGAGSVRTDAGGKFAFSKLEPGEHTVVVNRLGYFSKSVRTTVVAGEVSRVDVVIQQIPVAEPGFDEVMKWPDKLPVSDACAEREAHRAEPNEWPEQTRGVTWQRYTVPVNATKPDGTDLLAIRMQIDLKHQTSDATIDIDMILYSPEGKELKSGGSDKADEYIDMQSVMKPGNYLVQVCYWGGAQAEYKITATISYEQGDRATYLRTHTKEIEYPDDA
jgi:hypothetical protein